MEDERQTDENKQDHQQLSDEATPVVPKGQPVPPPTGDQDPEQQHSEPDDRRQTTTPEPRPHSHRWRYAFTSEGIVATATVVGVVALLFQLDQTNAALWEAREANRISSEARSDAANDAVEQGRRYMEQLRLAVQMAESAQRSANAAMDANTIAQQIRAEAVAEDRESQRAVLTLSFQILVSPTANRPGEFTAPVTNERSTPALRVRVKQFVVVPRRSAGQPTVTEQMWESVKWQDFGPVFAGEKGRNFRGRFDDIPADQLQRYIKDEGDLFVFIRMRYCDVFSKPHWFYRTFQRAPTRSDSGATIVSTEIDEPRSKRDDTECK
jgi:hypothetical protein